MLPQLVGYQSLSTMVYLTTVEVLKQELLLMKGFLNAKETIIKNLSVEVDLLKLKGLFKLKIKLHIHRY